MIMKIWKKTDAWEKLSLGRIDKFFDWVVGGGGGGSIYVPVYITDDTVSEGDTRIFLWLKWGVVEIWD